MKTICKVSLWIGLSLIPIFAQAEDKTQAPAPAPAQNQSGTTYTVTSDIPSLREIAILLYGDVKYRRKMIDWNALTPPYKLNAGQVLKLQEAPTLTAEEGRKQLVAMWKANLDRRDQLEGSTSPPPARLTLLDNAKKEFEEKHYNQAITLIEKNRQKDPGNVESFLYEIRAYLKANQPESAKKTAMELVSAHPQLEKLPFIQAVLKEGK